MKSFDLSKIGSACRALSAKALSELAAPPPQNRVVVVSPGMAPAVTAIVAGQIQPQPAKKARQPRRPTKTEAAAREFLLRTGLYREVRWNCMTFTLANGHRYTPDLVGIPKEVEGASTVELPQDPLVMVEVKGSYRLGSLQRSRLAFDQARIEWPMFTFAWMERRKNGTWRFG